MTNLEWLVENFPDVAIKCLSEIERIAIKDNIISVCSDTRRCSECGFSNGLCGSCVENRTKWLKEEHVENPKLTKREKAFLDAIDCETAYIARDDNGDLYVYGGRPSKSIDVYCSGGESYSSIKRNIYGDIFSFIKWEDPEPTSVKYLRTLEVEE